MINVPSLICLQTITRSNLEKYRKHKIVFPQTHPTVIKAIIEFSSPPQAITNLTW